MKQNEILILGGAALFAWWVLKGGGGAAFAAKPATVRPTTGSTYTAGLGAATRNPYGAWFNYGTPGVQANPYSLYDGQNDSLGLSAPGATDYGLGFTNSGGLGLSYQGTYATSDDGTKSQYALW